MRGQDSSGTAAAQATNDAIGTAQQVSEPSQAVIPGIGWDCSATVVA